ncbi:MAG: acetoacetate--CoA ligase [Nitrososphaerota archaeon]|nr:acetoacetate--CoA ligase [Nitrososphaerota archaeon]MDG6938810.1 acetoacetate--CoA ligase [Nitrososphaerota archaeon]
MSDLRDDARVLWRPSRETLEGCRLSKYSAWLRETRGLTFDSYEALRRWSVEDLEGFWLSIWEYFGMKSGFRRVLSSRKMPGAAWFEGAELNYAERAFEGRGGEGAALVFGDEEGQTREMTWDSLRRDVGSFAAGLREAGVGPGDRVAACVPNVPEAVVAFLATASLGAVWSSCSVDFGAPSVVDRFRQIQPKVFLTVDGYRYGGKVHDRSKAASSIRAALGSVRKTVVLPRPGGGPGVEGGVAWEEFLGKAEPPSFRRVPFDHPLWIVYSSGTTGLPKPIVHSHGGILLEHLKALSLHNDLSPSDRFFWFTATGWMMWNYLVGGLLVGSTVVLYDGSPFHPDRGALWDFAARTRTTFFGTSAAHIASCAKSGVAPAEGRDLGALRGVGSTGSPLPAESFEWVYRSVGQDVWLASISGGTDVCTAFVGGCPLLPVRAGEIQCICLGAAVESFDEAGKPVTGSVGELVLTRPMPSMPIFFWGDPDGSRYRESYFAHYPGVWRHGDWIRITPAGSCVIYGRSDATIKRMGVRLGSSEIYRAVESLQEVADSLVVGLEAPGGRSYMPLFVALREGASLDEALKRKIVDRVRTDVSPRFVPDDVFAVPEIPKTLNGKKLEVPVKRMLLGARRSEVAASGSLMNPRALLYVEEAASRRTKEVLLG